MPAEDGDIEGFIRQQKAKLANERQALNNNKETMLTDYDRIWQEQHGGLEPPQPYPGRPYRDEVPRLELGQPRSNSRRQWGEPTNLHPQSYGGNRGRPVNRRKEQELIEYEQQWAARHSDQDHSPRFRDNNVGRDHYLNHEDLSPGRANYKRVLEQYDQIWSEVHSKGASELQAQSRMAPQPKQYLDTEKLIRETVREKEEEEEARRRAYQPQSHRGPPPRGGPVKGRPDSFGSEYNRAWEKQHPQSSVESPRQANLGAVLIKDDGRDERLRKLEEERNKEYNELLRRKHYVSTPDRYGIHDPPDESEDYGLFHSLGADEKKRKEHQAQENKLNISGEHVVDMSARRGYQGSNLREQTDDHKASTLLNNQSDAAKLERIKERNNEYRDFLAKKNEKDQHRFDDKKTGQYNQPPDNGVYATLPGLRYSNSAQHREKAEERNKEYNELMKQKRQRGAKPAGIPPAAPKQGWGTPTPSYEQILEKKREQEAGYRKANDPGYQSDYNSTKENDPYARRSPIAHAAGRRAPNQGDGQYYASSLPLGVNGQSEEQRKKAEYARELRQQMEADKNARKIERREGALVNNTGATLYNPIVSTHTPRRETVKPYHTEIYGQLQELDRNSPRIKRRPALEDRRDVGGLNLGLPIGNASNYGGQNSGYNAPSAPGLGLDMSILERPNLGSVDPPAGLQYQPSTFITANAVPALNNSVDEAYNFYAGMNPLDPNQTAPAPPPGGGGGRGGREGGEDVPSLNLSGFGGGDDGAPSRVRFKDNRGRRTPAIGMDFATDDERKQEKKHNVSAYREELERQIQERNAKKRRDKEEQERYELKMEEEARNYDPFGKGGGGAPMRDLEGNVISDLRQMRKDNNDPASSRRQPDYSPRGFGGGYGGGDGFGGFGDPGPGAAGNTTRAANSYRDDLIGPPPAQTTADGDPSFARGGHGIFGMPKTDVEKLQADKYKLDLKRQIEEKKADEMRKKEKERQEDEREQRILEQQRVRIQQEYDEEQRKAKAKEEEARLKNEELIRLAEDKKKEIERQRREAEEIRQQELREQREREIRERQAMASPPVPATRTRTAEPEPHPQPHSTRRDPPRAQSADVLNQLADMRAQLRKERQRVQHMLDDQEDDVEVYDPRQIQRPPPAPIVSTKPEVDVFETAMNRNAVAVRRTPGERANAQAAEDFNALKHKNDSDSRKQFRQMFPNEPETSDALETQQLALLRHQEERLYNIKDRRALEDTSTLRLGRDTRSSSSQLHSNSAFVDVNGVSDFPDDFEDMPRRNESARAARRRARAPSSPKVERYATPDFNSRQTFGSQTSLNVDKLARKNEDRLRRLRDMQGDDLSLYDPDDVLDRFMTKQGHNRPPSRNTLLDDTWMRAGSKQSNGY